MKKMIFHIPMQIKYDIYSGSQIRPQKMIQAFKNISEKVDLIMGNCKTRKIQIEDRKKVLSFRIGMQGKHELSKKYFLGLNYTRKSFKSSTRNILEKYSLIKDTGRLGLNPYHNFFIFGKKEGLAH